MFFPLEAFLRLAFSTPNRREAATQQNVDQFVQSEFHWRQRLAGRNFCYPGRADAFLPEQLDKCRFASTFFPPLYLDRAQIRDIVAGVNRNTLRFHPPIIGKFFAPHCNDGFLFGCLSHKSSSYPFLLLYLLASLSAT